MCEAGGDEGGRVGGDIEPLTEEAIPVLRMQDGILQIPDAGKQGVWKVHQMP